MSSTVQELIKLYNLKPHPEGGYYAETFRDNNSAAIYFLLPKGAKSHLHRLSCNEIWHFYLGGPLNLIEIGPNGQVRNTILGNDISAGHKLQHVVPAGHWFGAKPDKGVEFSLIGCTTSPGFDFADLEMGKREELIKQFPNAKNIIKELT